MVKFARLEDRALIRVAGEDAEKFLQALVTCDVDHLAPGEANFGALLTPQGKILFDFFVIRTEQGFVLDVAADMRDDLVKRLNFYKLRAKVDVAPDDEAMNVFAAWDGEPGPTGGIAVPDPRLAELGWRIYAGVAPEGELSDYEAHRRAHGSPEGGKDYVFGDALPHEALMDQFGGVDFAKGCYVGQEVVSRMQHRGTARSRVVPVSLDGAAPQPGAPVDAGEKTVGAMGSAAAGRGLALLRRRAG